MERKGGGNILGELGNVVLHHLVRRIVEQDVNAAELVQGDIDDLLTVGPIGQICRQQVARPAVFLYVLLGHLCILLFVRKVCNQHVGSLHGKEDGR